MQVLGLVDSKLLTKITGLLYAGIHTGKQDCTPYEH